MSDSSNTLRGLSSLAASKNTSYPIPEECTLAERIAYEVTPHDDWHYIHSVLRLFPDRHAEALARRYVAIYTSSGRFKANTHLRTWIPIAKQAGIALRIDYDGINALAKEKCAYATNAARFGGSDLADQYRALSHYCLNNHIDPPEPDEDTGGTVTLEGCVKRMLDRAWWRRRLRKKLQQEREKIAARLGMISKRKDLYCSREARSDNIDQQARNEQLLSTMVATDGETRINLAEIAKSNVSNPEVRYAELMTRLKGFEQLVNEAEQETLFITVTCPSRMHSVLSKSGQQNPKWDGSSPADAHRYLQKTWELTRSKLNREKIQIEGYRIAEPHHDGTPHWHFALATNSDRRNDLVNIVTDYFTQADPDDKGIENRVKVEYVRSIAGYLSKYISKNIDGKHVDKDFHGRDAKDSAINVRAWASLWNIRQFQPIGGASVTTYRELRRVRDAEQVPDDMLEIHAAADAGDWAEYERLQGGLNTGKSTHKVKMARTWSDRLNRYGEATGNIISGLITARSFLDTRPKTWTIELADQTHVVNIVSLAAEIAEAMGHNNQELEQFQTYATAIESGAFHELPQEFQPLEDLGVQLFTRGQVGSASLAVAPTGTENQQPNAPPWPESPPIDSYEDHARHLPDTQDGPAMADEYLSYASIMESDDSIQARGAA